MRSVSEATDSLVQVKRKYLLSFLPYHLAKAGFTDRLKELLTDYIFLKEKIDLFDPSMLVMDFDYFKFQDLGVTEK